MDGMNRAYLVLLICTNQLWNLKASSKSSNSVICFGEACDYFSRHLFHLMDEKKNKKTDKTNH